MHIHILGICGTFMGGIAALAKAAGHRVTGCDANVYPPMSTQLAALGIDVIEGFSVAQLAVNPDYVVIGNAMSRGNPLVEAVLERRIAYCSGPQWLAEHVLHSRHVLAVSGTHGKTTTASLLAWILEDAGLAPGFLIGGIPLNFEASARFGESRYFVVEADEYDTAFFDKRAKFVHYRPQTLIINNLEYDHADIYQDLNAILWQFHQLMRTVPGNGRVIINGDDANIRTVIEQGCWTPVETFSSLGKADWSASFTDQSERHMRISHNGQTVGKGSWTLGGRHNLENALAAIAAARAAGVGAAQSLAALARFAGVKRRMERTATIADIAIYDDFAHHPTAIRRSIESMRNRYPGKRIVVALEPRSNTMRMGVHQGVLAASLGEADEVFVYRADDLACKIDAELAAPTCQAKLFSDYDQMVTAMVESVEPGDRVVFMSNGSFGAARQKLTLALQNRTLILD